MVKVLVTRPEHDDTTHYLSHWSLHALEIARKKGIPILDLHRKNANKQKFESMMHTQAPSFVIFNGHGDSDRIAGHKNEILVQSHRNEKVLTRSLVYAHSCSAAKVLGPLAVEEGAFAFLGYDEQFIFFYTPGSITKPLQDPTAKIFLEPSTEVISSLLKGNTMEEAQKRAKQLFFTQLSKMLSSEASLEDAGMAGYLWWDMKHLVLCGDTQATI